MNERSSEFRIELIAKYLAGEASPEEAMQLHTWMKDKNNRDEYEKAAGIWNSVSQGENKAQLTVDEQWRELNNKLQEAQKNTTKKLYRNLAFAASFIGLVLFISYSVFNKPYDSKVAQQPAPARIIKTAAEGVKTDTLPDGSIIVMKQNSFINYSTDYNTTSRELVLTGESFFDVVANEKKPFIINIGDLKIRVVGTSFNVREVASDKFIEVQVHTGVVMMYARHKELMVQKGQSGIYHTHGDKLILKETIDENSVAYATKSFSFNDVPFIEVCRYLEKAFNVHIQVDGEKFRQCRLTAQFNNKSLVYIMDIISATLGSSYRKQGNIIYIAGEGCQ